MADYGNHFKCDWCSNQSPEFSGNISDDHKMLKENGWHFVGIASGLPVIVEDNFDHEFHFCSRGCLAHWIGYDLYENDNG